MKPELYKELKKYAHQSFEETHVERQYSLNQYQKEGEFFMTVNERWFHLIGFIDARISFNRGNLFKDMDMLR